MTLTLEKPILLLDQDGPLADFDLAFYNMCVERGWELDIDSLDDPKRQRFMTDNMPNPRQRSAARCIVNETRWFRDLPVTEGALEGVPKLMEMFDVWVCTKPLEVNKHCRDDKAMWLRWWFPKLEHRLIITPDKSMVNGAILLDDAPRIEWCEQAVWNPVIFRSGFNGAGSEWELYVQWDWSQPVEELYEMAWV